MSQTMLRNYSYNSVNEAIDICEMKINSLPFKIYVILSGGLIQRDFTALYIWDGSMSLIEPYILYLMTMIK